MSEAAARLLHASAALVARLPWRIQEALARGVARLWRITGAREARVAGRNLELAYPGLAPVERGAMRDAVLLGTARQALDTLQPWTRPPADALASIRQAHGADVFDAALARARAGGPGVIVAAPHFGNWELLNRWLAARTEIAVLYRAPDSALGEAFLRRARADTAGRVVQVRAEGPAMRQLFKRLQAGGVVGILPDQQPKRGDGVFAPFFGVPALTMTLLSRLAARTGATVLVAWCERIGGEDGDGGGPRFAIHVEPAPGAIADPDPVVAATALNAAVEAVARRDPAQYQWTYKRYTLRPSGRGEDNPYRDLEGRRRR
jgi:KDO2-lipid IV(A) lauroyltransferase